MAYKDKDKQKEAQRDWVRQKRANQKGSTGLTYLNGGGLVVPDEMGPLGNPKRGKDIKWFEDLHPGIQATIISNSTDKDGKLDEGEKIRRTAIVINYQHLYPDRYEPQGAVCTGVVTGKPGDNDYDGICTPEWIAERKIR